MKRREERTRTLDICRFPGLSDEFGDVHCMLPVCCAVYTGVCRRYFVVSRRMSSELSGRQRRSVTSGGLQRTVTVLDTVYQLK